MSFLFVCLGLCVCVGGGVPGFLYWCKNSSKNPKVIFQASISRHTFYMPVRFIVIGIEWIKSLASRRCLWLIFQSTLETAILSPTVLRKKKKIKIFLARHMLFSTYAPWHLLLHSTTCSFHPNCLTLPCLSEFFSLLSLFFCQILFKWLFSLFLVCPFLAHFLMTLGDIQKAHLEIGKKITKKENIFYSKFFSHFKP